MSRHLLVTNDFPPKLGGIQSYLYELWRRLDPDSFAVLTTSYEDTVAWDARHPFTIERAPGRVLLPNPALARRINRLAAAEGAELIILDPAVPLGAIGPWLDLPYAVVLHGAEVTVPGRLPGSRWLLARTLRRAELVIAAGTYPLREAERCAGRTLPSVVIPPGVDSERFRPLSDDERAAARVAFDLDPDRFVIATVNRLVPRKGMDVLIDATAELARRGHPVTTLIGGTGRCGDDLEARIERTGAPARLLGRVSDDDVARLYGAADAMAMLCHDRWFGLEQEGFGIVFLEAAAAGVPQIAGRSGGAHEAVEDGETGFVEADPRDPVAVADRMERLVIDPLLRDRLGTAARKRVVAEFDYGDLAARLGAAIGDTIAALRSGGAGR